MNKGNLNKLVTNYPVELTEEEISNLSGTLAPVIAACGGGGGGTGGKIYTGIGFVTVNNTTNQIGLTNEANTKLNQDIPTKVSDLSDSANYQTVAGMDEYLTTANASTTYQTIEDMSAYYKKTETSSKSELDDEFSKYATVNQLIGEISNVTQTIDILQGTVDGKQDILTFGYDENDAISSINSHKLAGAGGVTGDYYSASNPSGFINSSQAETQILEKHYLTEASGDLLYIPIPEGLSDNQYYAYTTSSWKVIQGAGDVSGISTVAHDDTLTGNGNNENLGVDITKIQTKLTDAQIQNITDVTTLKTASAGWDAKVDQSDLNDYLTKTQYGTDSATFALKTQLDEYATKEYANNASANALSEAETWVENKHYLTEVPNTYALKTDIPTTVAQLTDSGNYYTKSETSGKSEITNALNTKLDTTAAAQTYQPLGDYVKNTDISLDANNKITAISGKELIITAHQSLTNYYTKDETSGATQLSTEFGKYLTKTIADGYYYPLSTNPSNYATSAGLTQSKQYAMTTTGWSEITGGGSTFTGVTTASPITGDGLNNTLGLDSNYKTAIEQVSGKVDKPADMTSNIPYCFSAGQWTDITQTYYSKTEATGTFLQKHLTNTLSGDGTTNNTLGVNWSNLSSNLINSANTASNAWISGTEFSSFAQIKTAIDSKQSASDYVHISGDTMTGGLTISASSGKNVLAVASAASLLGASRQTSANYGVNDTALGTTWMGVGGPGMYRGFLKYTQGGNVGDLDTDNTMQVEFSPNNKGTIFAKAKNNGTDCPETQILNPVKTTCDNMSASGIDANNMSGPNYMIAKNADGQFVIGAAVFNCQNNLPGTLQPNTYYFVY